MTSVCHLCIGVACTEIPFDLNVAGVLKMQINKTPVDQLGHGATSQRFLRSKKKVVFRNNGENTTKTYQSSPRIYRSLQPYKHFR